MQKFDFLDQLAHFEPPEDVKMLTTFTNKHISINLTYQGRIKTLRYDFNEHRYISVTDEIREEINLLKNIEEKLFKHLIDGQWFKTNDKCIYWKTNKLLGLATCMRFDKDIQNGISVYISNNTKVQVIKLKVEE